MVCPGVSTVGVRRLAIWAVGFWPLTPGAPGAAGTCITMQCITPAAVARASLGTCTMVLSLVPLLSKSNACCTAASAWALCPALVIVAFAYDGNSTRLLHTTMLA